MPDDFLILVWGETDLDFSPNFGLSCSHTFTLFGFPTALTFAFPEGVPDVFVCVPRLRFLSPLLFFIRLTSLDFEAVSSVLISSSGNASSTIALDCFRANFLVNFFAVIGSSLMSFFSVATSSMVVEFSALVAKSPTLVFKLSCLVAKLSFLASKFSSLVVKFSLVVIFSLFVTLFLFMLGTSFFVISSFIEFSLVVRSESASTFLVDLTSFRSGILAESDRFPGFSDAISVVEFSVTHVLSTRLFFGFCWPPLLRTTSSFRG
mmetsp:Transcript_27061/g.65777  ORF Transcript_27061/g.65777 Transcript_27061/m.65777 type:complete len:263 (-) Transcript_27061:2133-2921(-)